MPVLAPTDPILGDTGETYVSPFPSSDAYASAKFKSLLEAATSGNPEAIASRWQVDAWDRAQRVLMRRRFTAELAGGIRSDWLPAVASVLEEGGLELVRGMFSAPQYTASTNADAYVDRALDVGLQLAQNVLSNVPILGLVFRAAVGVGRFMWKLANRSKEEIELRVPWQEYSKPLDEDVVNTGLSALMEGIDWTPLYWPALDWKSPSGFRMEKTKRGGQTRAFGVWTPSGEPNATAGGLGFMPGTEQLTDVIQVAQVWAGTGGKRRDAVTDVGAFLPSVSQFGTSAWAMVNRQGNPDMFKVRAGELADAWRGYFDALFADAFGQYEGLGVNDFEARTFLSKLLAPLVVAKGSNYTRLGINVEELGGPYITPEIFDPGFVGFSSSVSYARPDDALILPALGVLKQRQKSMLARSLACALVRPVEVAGMPAFAAFEDSSAPLTGGHSTFGEELRAYCLEMREVLLTHPQRFRLAQPKPGSITFERWAPDVRAVDPVYAAKLEATFGSGIGFAAPKVLGLGVDLDNDAPPPGPELEPEGGPPWLPGAGGWLRRWGAPIGAGILAAGGIGAALWKGEAR